MNNIRPDIITGTISTINAIQSLVPDFEGGVSTPANPDDGEIITWHKPKVASVTLEEIEAEKTRLLAEWTAQEYARNRATAFPSIGDQLDMQYHDQLDGTTTWKDAVAKVKSDNPKE